MAKIKHKPKKCKPKTLHRDFDVHFALFEVQMHDYLNLLGAPPGDYIAIRLKEYLQGLGKLPKPKIEPTTHLVQQCHNCQTIYAKGAMCPKCF